MKPTMHKGIFILHHPATSPKCTGDTIFSIPVATADANTQTDTALTPKTLLGKEQLSWLKQQLAASKARWQVIVSSVPIAIPTGGFADNKGRDGWANFEQNTCFEHELLDLLRFMQQQGIKNSLWLTTDVHFAEGFRYTPFKDAPDFKIYEFASCPLNADFFPKIEFDTSLNPEKLFYYGKPGIVSYDEALDYFNFGAVTVDEQGDISVSIINAEVKSLPVSL